MIELLDIRATAHPEGNRIDLEWVHPDPAAWPGVRVARRQGTWPTEPEPEDPIVHVADLPFTVDGEGRRVVRWSDEGLAGETVFYYMLFPFTGDPTDVETDARNRVSAMTGAPHGYGERMAALLPAIYRRYDDENARRMPTELIEKLLPEDQEKGPLRRFLELAGSHLDHLHSLARSSLGLHDPERLDGHLLPLLAQWIGWPTDHRLEVRAQRSEIRKAPYIYRTVGLGATVEATVKRILGWESRTKELVDNVFLSNRPERLNLWLAEHDDTAGSWSQSRTPLSLNYAYEGRPAAAYGGDGRLWLFFHTRRKRTKVSWSGGVPKKSCRRGQWDVWYKTFTPEEGWTPSRPLTDDPAIDKHPSVAFAGDTLWVFWSAWSETDSTWHLCYRTYRQGTWSPREQLWDAGTERRRPQAVADGQGNLWLFWQERAPAGGWQVSYNRHDGDAWELPAVSPGNLRGAAEEDPRTEEDLFVFLEPDRLWVFWARRDMSADRRWRIAYRKKPDLDLAFWNWEDVHELPPSDPEASDREPVAVAGEAGSLELYWSANRDRSWSIWRADLDTESLAWSPPEQLTGHPFSQRGPLAVAGAAVTLLFYYSNQSLAHDSTIYEATEMVDGRYAGSTTVDARNVIKTALHRSFDDCLAYTFDTGAGGRRGDANWYAHDTVALYVTPSREDPSVVARDRSVLARVLRQFLPIQVRAVMVLEPAPYEERIYDYDFPDAGKPLVIGELAIDSTLPESYDGLSEESFDTVPAWVRVHSWSPATPSHRSVDFTADPVDTSRRTWHIGLEPGGEP